LTGKRETRVEIAAPQNKCLWVPRKGKLAGGREERTLINADKLGGLPFDGFLSTEFGGAAEDRTRSCVPKTGVEADWRILTPCLIIENRPTNVKIQGWGASQTFPVYARGKDNQPAPQKKMNKNTKNAGGVGWDTNRTEEECIKQPTSGGKRTPGAVRHNLRKGTTGRGH